MVITDFLGWQDQFLGRLKQADGLDLRRVRARSPVIAWLKYSLGISFAAYLAHQRRHLWQARQVRNAPGFPYAAAPIGRWATPGEQPSSLP
jgi:hypothetical protein